MPSAPNSSVPNSSAPNSSVPKPPASDDSVPRSSAPAGWYRDPLGVAQLRWWDGLSWTDHTEVRRPEIQMAKRDVDRSGLAVGG